MAKGGVATEMMEKKMMLRIFCALALMSATSASAQDAPGFAGKTINLVIAFEAGGSYDIYGRLFARYFGNHLPGKPRVVVQNMPGAGGLNGANYLAEVAPRDGTVIGEISQTAAIGQVLETQGVRYDVRKFSWIGRVTSNVQLMHVWHTAKAKSFQDALTIETVVAGTGPTSSSVVFPKIMNDLFGTKFRVVAGFPGVASATLAMERGEVEAVVRPWAEIAAKNADWMRDRKIYPLVQFSLARHPELKDYPAIVDLAKDQAQKQLLSLFASGSDVGNAIVAPPGVPAAVVAVLRRAFDETMQDPELRVEAARAALEIDWLAGDKLQGIVESTFDIAPEVIEKAKVYSSGR